MWARGRTEQSAMELFTYYLPATPLGPGCCAVLITYMGKLRPGLSDLPRSLSSKPRRRPRHSCSDSPCRNPALLPFGQDVPSRTSVLLGAEPGTGTLSRPTGALPTLHCHPVPSFSPWEPPPRRVRSTYIPGFSHPCAI